MTLEVGIERQTNHHITTNTRFSFAKSNIFAPNPPSVWTRLQRSPLLFIAQSLYAHQPPTPKPKPKPASAVAVKVVCISDTHNEQLRDIPLGDILIHAGDLTVNGTFEELQLQLGWLNSLPHQHKIVIAGNHDLILDQSFFRHNPRLASSNNDECKMKELRWGNVVYLRNELRVLDIRDRTVRVYGSPMTPRYGNWAFQYPENEDRWRNTIPEATDILVTHGPAKGHVDSSPSSPAYLQGCAHLQRELWRAKPRLHVCGHIHSARGVEQRKWEWLEQGYDAVCRGEGRVSTMPMMLASWVWSWVLFALGRESKGIMTSVNAAVVGDWGLVQGEKTLIVDL
jgi:Icc-related predicted phosphoesterase